MEAKRTALPVTLSQAEVSTEESTPELEKEAVGSTSVMEGLRVVQETVRNGDTLSDLFQRAGVSSAWPCKPPSEIWTRSRAS